VALLIVCIVGREWILQARFVYVWLTWFSVRIWLVDPAFLTIIAVACPLMFYGTRSRVDTLIGELSYPVYICHIFIKALIPGVVVPPGNWLYVLTVVAASVMLYVLIDRPIGRLRHRLAMHLYQASATRGVPVPAHL